jgi:hypothetical protein
MTIIEKLLKSKEPSIRYKVKALVLGASKNNKEIKKLGVEIKRSRRVRDLLKKHRKDGKIEPMRHIYKKWSGAHWILATLADIGYPEHDHKLYPAIAQVVGAWLDPVFTGKYICSVPVPAFKDKAVPVIQGRARRCASQQGNALFSALKLGFNDESTDRLAALLMDWQWPDGGWNCDRKPGANHSSFWESLIPLRALSLYARIQKSRKALSAAEKAADLFLRKMLFKKESNGQLMNEHFVKLHYPCYWKYDILFGLKVMAEAGLINDRRCRPALDLLEKKRLQDDGWPAEERFYRTGDSKQSGVDLVDWGGVNKKVLNEWVTVDALFVLKKAGRL